MSLPHKQLIVKKRKSMKLKESTDSAKPESMGHYQSLQHELGPLATNTTWLKLALSAIKEVNDKYKQSNNQEI